MCGHLVDVVVLGVEVGDDFGVVLVAQPLIGVHEDIAVVFAAGLDPFSDRWQRHAGEGVRHAPGPIQVSKLKPEIRS